MTCAAQPSLMGAVPTPCSPLDDPPLSWSQTTALIGADFTRLIGVMGGEPTLAKRVFWFLLPGYQALFWYRLSRWLYLKHWRSASRLLFLFSIYWTRIEIPPTTAIGAACFPGHAPKVLCGRIGERFNHYGDGARLGPTCTVTRDVPTGAVVAAAAARILARPEASLTSHSSHSSVSAA